MARIPIYEQRTAPGNLGPSVRMTGQPVASIGGALQNAGQVLGNIAQNQYREQQQTIEDRAAIDAANVLSKGDAYWNEQTRTRFQTWNPGDKDLRETIGADYDKWIEESAASLPTERARNYFRSQAIGMRTRIDRSLFDMQERRTVDVLAQKTQEGMDSDFEVIYQDPNRRADVVARRLAVLEAQTRIPPEKRMEIGRLYVQGANMAAERSEMERDPQGYYARRFGRMPSSPVPGAGGSAGFDSAVSRVLKHEGGFAANDGNTGAPVNFGINQKANPDIDVKNISREDAIEIYRTRYWNAINGDTLPAELQGTALDAAVNQGPANARKWIAESGGDVVKFNQLRRQHYEALLAKPEFARFRKTWMRRLESYEQQAAGTLPASEDAVEGTAPASFMGLPYQERERLRREVDQRIRQQTAVAAEGLRGRLQDSTAMAKDGIPDKQPLTRDAFAVLGKDADAAFGEYQRNQVMANDIAAMQGATNAELNAVATGASRRAVPGEGYAAEDQRDQIRAQAAGQVLKQREADPAGYVSRTVPAVTNAAKAVFDPNLPAEQRGAAVQNLAAQTLAAQRTLGIAEPKVLSAAAMNDLGRRITQASRPEDAANLIAMLEAEYGPQYFPQVMNELMRSEKLPAAMMIIPNLPNAGAREIVSRLSVMKMDDLKTGIDSASQRDVREGAVSYASELARTLPPVSNSGAALLGSYQDMIERIAYERLRTGQDKSGSAAAESAFKMLLGHYQFDDQLRLPANASVGQTRSALSFRMDKDVVPGLTSADVPADLSRAYKPEEALVQWRDLVATNGVWYTAPDDNSVQLWVRGTNGVLYRVTRGGQQVSYTFDNLSTVTPAQLSEPHNRGRAAQRRFREQLNRETQELRQRVEAEDAARGQGAQ